MPIKFYKNSTNLHIQLYMKPNSIQNVDLFLTAADSLQVMSTKSGAKFQMDRTRLFTPDKTIC